MNFAMPVIIPKSNHFAITLQCLSLELEIGISALVSVTMTSEASTGRYGRNSNHLGKNYPFSNEAHPRRLDNLGQIA